MTIPRTVRYFARETYKAALYRGKHKSMFRDYSAEYVPSENHVVVGNYQGDVWYVPVAKAWLNG